MAKSLIFTSSKFCGLAEASNRETIELIYALSEQEPVWLLRLPSRVWGYKFKDTIIDKCTPPLEVKRLNDSILFFNLD